MSELGLSPDFEEAGENESYLQASFDVGNDTFEVYIYEDEAGFFLNGKWRIWESQDYDSEELLIEAFSQALQSQLGSSATAAAHE